jgi:hypothetical protein
VIQLDLSNNSLKSDSLSYFLENLEKFRNETLIDLNFSSLDGANKNLFMVKGGESLNKFLTYKHCMV